MVSNNSNINPISNNPNSNDNKNLNSTNNSNGTNNSTPNNKDPWELDEPSNRQKLIRFIIDWVKEGATDEDLLDILTPQFFKRNDIPPFDRRDIQGIIDWARRKFPKDK